MADLRVSLEEGFTEDHVVVRVDGATVFEEPRAATRTQTGLLAAFDVDAGTASTVEVSLPARGIAGELTVDATRTPFVRVSVVGDAVDLSATDVPPYYA